MGSSEQVSPVTLLQGSERALVERELRSLRSRLAKIAPEAEWTTVSAVDYVAGEMASLVAPSLFSEERVVHVEGVQDTSPEFESDLLGYLKNPAPGVWMILEHAGGNKAPRVPRAVKGAGFPVVSCAPVKSDRDKSRLVVEEVRAAGGSITPGAADALVAAVRDELMELLASARQLVADSGGTVDEGAVRTYFRGRVETRPWEVAEALAEGDGVRSFLLARQALTAGVAPVMIVAALASTFRTLAKAKVPGLPNSELDPRGWLADKARRNARGWREDTLGRALVMISEADVDVKGRMKASDAAVELCIVRIARARQSA